jgi:type IV secretory pathway ATPase VirB11/archaellum biosynthesis ATPase
MITDFSGFGGREIEIEIEKRAAVLEWMKEWDIRNIFEVGKIIQEYYRDPEAVLRRVKTERRKK